VVEGDYGMSIKRLFGILLRITLSVIFAGVLYTGWLAIVIPIFKSGFGGWVVKGVLWIVAPIITGLGFTVGPVIFELWPTAEKSGFWRRYKWTLVWCAIGGGICFLFGPMLIVFGMFGAGTLSVMIFEVLRLRKGPDGTGEAPFPRIL
jgi:hypothetical protein